jgi:hypothetical protein
MSHEIKNQNWIPASPAFAGVTAGMTSIKNPYNEFRNELIIISFFPMRQR